MVLGKEDGDDDDGIMWLTGLCNLRPASEGEEIDDVVDYELNDLLSKVLMIINQVIY